MNQLFIPVIAGTARDQRKSIHAARFIADVGTTIEGIKTEVIDPKDFHFPGDGNDPENKDPRYTELTQRADGFFILTPEYNFGIPGSLKRMLDSEFEHYFHKAVAFGGCSSGPWGGVRAIEQLVGSVRKMGLVPISKDIQFPFVQDIFSEDGALLDEAYVARAETVWQELVWMTNALKQAK